MKFTINRLHILLAFDCAWMLFIMLSGLGFHQFELLSVAAFISLVCMPGILTILALRITGLDLWGYIALMVGFSLAELMGIGLLGNAALPYLGVRAPLSASVVVGEVTILLVGLIVAVWVETKATAIHIRRFLFFNGYSDIAYALVPAFFVVCVVFGAIQLNNGSTNVLSYIALIGIGVYCILLIRYADDFGPSVIPTGLFFVSLSLLLMTSLRGWYITGHDIQREYDVFQLTKNFGLWSISNYRDAYNACMSITILPTMFGDLFGIPDPYIFKVLFQIFFATVPSILYVTVRRYIAPGLALTSVLYFVAFPTFFTDMPFLIRQEIAFLFLALMLYILFEERVSVRMRRTLFVVFGIGMVLSHYSTTYTAIALLIFLLAARSVLPLIRRLSDTYGIFRDSGIAVLNANAKGERYLITIPMVLILMGASFVWSSTLTDTSSNSLYRVIAETVRVIRSNAKEDAQSSDVLYGLFSFKHFDPQETLLDYSTKVVVPAHMEAPPGTYFDESVYRKYQVQATTPDLLPQTTLGDAVSSIMNTYQLNYIVRQSWAKVLQIFILIGMAVALWRVKYVEELIPTEFALLALGSLMLVVSIIILPVLSVEYGLLRAFQQSLIFLGIFITFGSCAVCTWAGKKQSFVAGVLAVLFLWSSTGVFTEALGDYDAQLHLNNSGTYYDIYYRHESEIEASAWLQTQGSGSDPGSVQSELLGTPYAPGRITSIADPNPLNDIFPSLIRKDAYVFLNYANVHTGKSTFSFNGTLITYAYPTQLLDENKNLVYNNGDVKIYR